MPMMPFRGDHGTGTAAAMAGTELVEVEGDKNRMGRRQRVEQVEWMMKRGLLDMRQYQAAQAIRDAYCRAQMLSSGSPLKERVQASPKPDATIAAQVDAVSRLAHVMRPVLRSDRMIVESICWHNYPVTQLGRMGVVRGTARFRIAMDRVADWLRF